jgi:radical SAM superfamily enzyme YgiQ (UPF0313 family)
MSLQNKKTIILFNPMPVKHPVAQPNKKTTSLQVPLVNVPLSLLALARMVRDRFDVRIINAVVDPDYTELILDACDNALCLAVSSMTCYQISDGIDVSRAVKEMYPDLPVIWGGYHPSSEPTQTLESLFIDIVIRGQGEHTFREVVEKLGENGSPDGISGVSYKNEGSIKHNPDRKFADINAYPAIPYDMIDVERHVKGYKFGTRCLDYYLSQGCASGCSFCSEPVFCGRRWSGLLPERAVNEMEHLSKTYNIDTFMIRDSDFFLNMKSVKALCELLIEKDLNIRLTSVNARMERFSRIDDDIISLCRRAGIHEVFFGFESGLQEGLDAMNKGAKVSQIRTCTQKCRKHDIDIRGSFMVGIPGMDVKKEVESNFSEINSLICTYGEKLEHLDVLLSFFTPYPNTPLYQTSIQCGLRPLDTLADWGEFDQFDFKAPWLPQDYFDLVREFRAAMPWNSGCDFEEWRAFYDGIMERLEKLK